MNILAGDESTNRWKFAHVYSISSICHAAASTFKSKRVDIDRLHVARFEYSITQKLHMQRLSKRDQTPNP